jgi:hypothetical protein
MWRRRREIELETYFFCENAGIHNLLVELEEKQLQWPGHVRMDRTSVLRRGVELNFKGKRPME